MVVLMTHNLTRFNVFLVLMGVLAASTGASLALARQQKAQVVEISVERFSFTPSEFRVKAGAPVEIRLRSEDTDHGFRIIGTDVNVQIPKRRRDGDVRSAAAWPLRVRMFDAVRRRAFVHARHDHRGVVDEGITRRHRICSGRSRNGHPYGSGAAGSRHASAGSHAGRVRRIPPGAR
jgi:hypothetical protein